MAVGVIFDALHGANAALSTRDRMIAVLYSLPTVT